MYIRKIVIISIVMLSAHAAFSQTSKVAATLVINNNDTIKGEVKVWLNLFDRKLINELSFHRRTWLAKDDEFIKISSKKIYYLEFVDFKEKQRIFVSDKVIPNFPDKGLLFERIVEGRLSWYKEYLQNRYDGSIVTIDHFCLENEEPVTLRLFANRKKRLKELTQEFPQLIEFIDTFKTHEDLVYIVDQFNTLSKSTYSE